MKYASKTIRILRKRKKLFISIIVLIILLALYSSDNIVIYTPERLAQNIQSKFGLDFFPMWLEITRPIFRIEDDINLFRIKKNLLDGELPIYSLDLSPNDLRYFDNLSNFSFWSCAA